MSVKQLEYLRISNSKILVVEVRPVKCLLDTSLGPALTDKWLEYSHWQELYHLLADIAEEYEEQKITQGIKCNQPKCKIGAKIQVGYMFRSLPSCWCSLYFLTPRSPPILAKNDNGELQDKGGRFENFGLCGEMLVVSVILRDSLPSSTTEVSSTPSSSGTYQQECLNHKLIKALDCRATYTTSISNYFKTPTASAVDISAKCVSSSSRERQRSPPLRVKTNTRFSGEHEGKRDECSESVMEDINNCDSSFKPSRSNYLEEINSETEEKEIDLPCGISVHNNVIGTNSFHNSLEYTKSNFTSITYNNENLENSTERSVEPAYQCSDITSDGTYNTSVSSLNENIEMLSDSKIHMYQYDTVNDSNVSCSVSTNTCNSLTSNSELGNVQLGPQSDRSTARDTAHEVVRNSKFHTAEDDSTLFDVVRNENIGIHQRDSCNSLIPSSNFNEKEQNLRSLEVDKPHLNVNEPEIKVEDQNDALSCQIHDDYLLETNTPKTTTEWRNLPSSEPECASTSGNWTTDSENPLNTAQMLEDTPVLVECKGEFIQEEAPKDSFSLTSINDSHARYVNVLEEDLHDFSDSTEKYAGQEMPNTSIRQEYLPPRLLTSITEQALVKEQCESFETPKSKIICQTQNIRKKKRVHESLTVISKVSYLEDEDEWIGNPTSSKYAVAGKDNAREDVLPTVNETLHTHSESHQLKHDLLQYNSASSSSCENPCGAIADSAHEVNKESSGQNVLETCSSKCPNNGETSEPSGYVDNPTIKLEFQDNAPYRADEEYVPQHVTCKWKKNKNERDMLNPELDYIPTDLKKLSPRNKRSCPIKDSLVQGNLACNIGASKIDPVGYSDETKLEFQTNAPCRVDKENVLEKVAHNCEKGKKQKNVPTNLSHITTEHVSCSSDGSDVQESELAHGTSFIGFPSCVKKIDCVPKRKLQQIQTTDTCDSLFIRDKKRDTDNIFEEDFDSVSINKNKKNDSQEMPDAMETPQGLVSHLNEENNHRKDYPQSFQSCINTTELNKEPLMKSTMFDSQKAAQEGRRNNHPSKQSLRSFRFLNNKDEAYMKIKGSRNKKPCHNTADVEINSYINQKKESKKEQITNHISGSDTALKSSLCVHDFYSISLHTSNSEQVDAYKGSMRPEILGHKHDSSSLQSSTSVLISQDRARNILSNVNQSNKRKKRHPGGKEDKAESNNQSVSNSKKCAKQIKRQKANREAQVLKDCNNPKMKSTGDDGSDEDLMPTKTSTPEKKGKSAPVNETCVSSPKKKKSEKCVTQAEELDQSEQDFLMEEDESCLRRSYRLRKRNLCMNIWCDGEESDTETEKYVKFFEQYKKKKERKIGKSNPERDEEWILNSRDKGRCREKKGKRGSKSAEPESMENEGAEKLHRESNTPSKVLKNSEKSNRTPQKLLTPTARKKREAPLKGRKKMCNLTFDDGREEKRVESKKKSMKEGRKMSASPKRKEGSFLKKGVTQRDILKSSTSRVYDFEEDLENCATTSKMKPIRRTMLAGMEKHDAVGSGSVSKLRSFRKPHRSPRSENESSGSEAEEEQPQPTEREDDIELVYYQDLDSLKSSYKRLQCMTETDLEEKLNENLSYLERVILGRVHNERHEMFISSLQQLKRQQDYLISGPFTENQTEHVLELLKKKLGHLDSLFDDMYDLLAYRCRVLMPTFLTKIVMDNENVNLKMAEQLLVKFSVNHKIHETTNNRDWRKF